ncbi:hypothetical protein EDD18DRAFT_1440537 [Armillaria luteobubalina]|uniref:F-box domain-containing protein n=1 Tax=Armillaria luteobubalina TaxID=153913 RepID=A0AA39P9B2_9AGAR|nr:hypothetical protein EDD18DRAFT_1440537 [Armillaria luteobubalina]
MPLPTPKSLNSFKRILLQLPFKERARNYPFRHTRLKDRNQALENHVNAKKILSPSRRLSPELLTEIFIRCSSSYIEYDSPLDPRALPWTVSHVCRKWREVAIGTPEIWSSIRLNFVHDRFLNGRRALQASFMLGVVLDRARPCNLDVTIVPNGDISTHPAYAVLLPSVRYWKSLEVSRMRADSNLDFLSPCRGFFDRLETVVLYGEGHLRSGAIDTFAVAPCLRSFSKMLDAQFLLPSNLAEFEDYDPFNTNTHATLHSLVNIEKLTIQCSSYSSELPRIQLPRLAQLELKVDLRSLGEAFVTSNHFEFPFLTHLHLDLRFYHETITPLVLQPISSSTVSSLTLTWTHILPPSLIPNIGSYVSSLVTLPNLRRLTLRGSPNMNTFLGALSILPGKDVIFPKMSTLDIKCEYDNEDYLNMHILVELIQSRIYHGALREFNIMWQRGVVSYDADIRSRWQQLSSPGGGIQISASIRGLEAN